VPSCATFGFSAPSDARGALLRARKRPRKFTSATLWEARLSDLQRLKALRWFGDPMPDFRDRWLFVAGVGMSWLAVPQVLRRELFALAREVGGWTERETRSKLHAIFRTAHEAAAGRRVEWQGLEIDPRYRMRNQTTIEALACVLSRRSFARNIKPTAKLPLSLSSWGFRRPS
jgi:hypothetical protein